MQIIERAGGELLIARLPTAEDIADAINCRDNFVE